jgi:hypothetical protein
MIIVKFIGGLGNQMFQYSFYRYLKKNYNDVKADITDFFSYKLHNGYVLEDIFNVKVDKANFYEILQLREENRRGVLYKIKRKILGRKSSHIKEEDFSFTLSSKKQDLYLDGYWGSEKYFKDIEGIIRKEFTVKYAPDEQNQNMINQIVNCESVSIHIRRGDFASCPSTIKLHGVCSMVYYKNAIEKLMENINKPHFFIFSDDQQWTQQNMKLSFPTTFVNINGADKDYEDLRLMSLCKHNIIANSTFSWWSAWLNDNPEKIVIAPKKWFADPIRNAEINFEDLYPKKWKIL